MDLPVPSRDALAQETRARLFALLVELRRSAGTDELADELGLHPNGVRNHLERMEQAIQQSVATGSMVNHASEVARLAEAYLLAGRLADAHEHAERALQLARTHRESGNEAIALRLLGDVEARRPEAAVETARRHYAAALALATPRMMAPLIAACR